MYSRIQEGDLWEPTADFINAIQELAEQNEIRYAPDLGDGLNVPEYGRRITCIADEKLPAFSPVVLSESAIAPDCVFPPLHCRPASASERSFFIALEGAGKGEGVSVQCYGLTPCRVNVARLADNYAVPGSGGVIASSSSGSIPILTPLKKTGTQWVVLNLSAGGGASAPSDYNGMFKLELQTKKGEAIEGSGEVPPDEYYLNIAWPDSNYTDTTVVGIFQNEQIKWPRAEKVSNDTDVYFDPFGRRILLIEKSGHYVNKYILLGNYSSRNNAVTQVTKVTSGGLDYSGYTGSFLLSANKDGAYVTNGIRKIPMTSDNDSCGSCSINGLGCIVPAYSGAINESETGYYIRHTIAQTATTGDEDSELSEEEKQNLRDRISEYDTTIADAQANIDQYSRNIAGKYRLIDAETAKIAPVNESYNKYIKNAETIYNADISVINAEIGALNSSDPDYAEKKKVLEQEKKTRTDQYNRDIASYESQRSSELNAITEALKKQSSEIQTERNKIVSENNRISTASQMKNTACLKLYGTIPGEAKCEIVALPSGFNTSQTDQYIYFQIGTIVPYTDNGQTVYYITQTYTGGGVNMIRFGNSCAGFPE